MSYWSRVFVYLYTIYIENVFFEFIAFFFLDRCFYYFLFLLDNASSLLIWSWRIGIFIYLVIFFFFFDLHIRKVENNTHTSRDLWCNLFGVLIGYRCYCVIIERNSFVLFPIHKLLKNSFFQKKKRKKKRCYVFNICIEFNVGNCVACNQISTVQTML